MTSFFLIELLHKTTLYNASLFSAKLANRGNVFCLNAVHAEGCNDRVKVSPYSEGVEECR